MKNLKLFTAALAVMALASCSDDNLLTTNEDFVKDPSKLYVTVEPLNDGMAAATRAGFVYGTTASGGSHGQYFVWTKGDQIKIYDDNQNWRTQVWEFIENAPKQYKKAEGFSVFGKSISIGGDATAADDAATKYTNAYGVYPADLGSFSNENRTEFTFNLSSLAKYNLDRVAVTENYEDGFLAKAPIPMWGVATSATGASEMKVKYLTGILKVDIAQLPATTGTNHNWLAVQSKIAGAKGNLHPAVVTADFTPEEVGAAPALKVQQLTGAATDLTADYTIATAASDVILIDLGTNLATADPSLVDKRCCIAVPIVVAVDGAGDPVEQELSAYLYKEIGAAATTLPVASQRQIGSSIEKTVVAGTSYLIQDEINKKIDANTPFNLAAQIKSLDENADRTVNIEVQSNITVDDTNVDEHGFVIDLSEYALKNNINVSFKASTAFEGKSNGGNTLIIRTKAGGKGLLTINVAEGTNKLKSIKVDNGLAGKLKLEGTITKIEAGNANLTIAADVTTVDATAETNIDGTGKTIATLNVLKGCDKVNVLNGAVTKAQFSAVAANKIAAPVEFHTEGTGNLVEVDYTNVPLATGNKSYAYAVNYTTKWDGTASVAVATTISGTVKGIDVAGTSLENVTAGITSAAQLKGYAAAAATRILAKEIDLDGKELQNATALAAAVNGNFNVYPSGTDVPTASANIAQADIQNLQIGAAATNLADGNYGLFKSTAAGAAIYNLKISDAKILGKSGSINSNVGTLIGQAGAAVTVQNVDVTGLEVTITGTTDYASAKALNIGGVIGQVTGGTATMLDVTSAGAISANASIGGIIGNVAAAASSLAVFGKEITKADTKFYADQECSSTIAMTPTAGQAEYDPVYAKVGTLVGSSDFAGVGVKIYTLTAPSVTIVDPEKAKVNRVTGTLALLRYNLERGLDEVGFGGITAFDTNTTWEVDVYVSNAGATAATAKAYKAKAYNTTAPNTSGWTIAQYAALTTPEYYGWNVSTQYVTE